MSTNKKETMLKAALELFVENGIHQTSTNSIAKKAGVANGTPFHFYKNKNALVDGLYLEVKMNLKKELLNIDSDNFEQRSFEYWKHTANWLLNHPMEYRFIKRYYDQPHINLQRQIDLSKELFDFIYINLDKAIKSKIIKKAPTEYLFIKFQLNLFLCCDYILEMNIKNKNKFIIQSYEHLMNGVSLPVSC